MTEKYIERGWENYRQMVVPADASPVQIDETRRAFYAGAAVLFHTIMRVLDPSDEPTEADLANMDDISRELDAFGQEIDKHVFGQHEH